MKALLIVYAISWLILLAVYLFSRLSKNWDPNRSKDPWYILAIIIGLAPFTVLLIPYILWKSKKEEKEQKRRDEDLEQREKEIEERRKSAEVRYNKANRNFLNADTDEMIEDAQALHRAVREESYDSILKIMDKTTVLANAKLQVREADNYCNDIGDQSKLIVLLDEEEHEAFDYLRFEGSCLGAWQAYLLHQLWHSLPLYWHANYAKRDYLYSWKDLSFIYHMRNDEVFPDFSNYDLTPRVYRSGDYYYISVCFWTEFGGLIREYVELRLSNGKLTEFVNFRNDTIYNYDCGFLF